MVSFPPASPPRPYTHPLLTHTRHMPSPSHSSRFYHRTILGEEYRSFSSSLCDLLHSPVTSPLVGENLIYIYIYIYIYMCVCVLNSLVVIILYCIFYGLCFTLYRHSDCKNLNSLVLRTKYVIVVIPKNYVFLLHV